MAEPTYVWTWAQQISHDWPDWFRKLFGIQRWENPRCDVADRHLCVDEVMSSIPIEWPTEWANVRVSTNAPRQTPWQGSVQGSCVQMVNPDVTKTFTVRNEYGGTLFENGDKVRFYNAGETYDVEIPVPIRNGWGLEGYPNGGNLGDRHWFGIEPDGTAHEVIWINVPAGTVASYTKWSPDGKLAHGVLPGGTVVKGGIQWTAHGWNRWDRPHRLGLVFSNLSGGDGDLDVPHPSYRNIYRLSEEAYYNHLKEARGDGELRNLLDSMRIYGMVPYDRGGDGNAKRCTIGTFAGAQMVGSSMGKLNVQLKDLELVVDERFL